MKNNIIQEIWEIKNISNQAIDENDMSLFEVAQERFRKLYTEKHFLNTIATSTPDCEFDSVEEMLLDREQNFAIIAVELAKDKKRVAGIEEPTYFQFSSIFGLIWWNCWMLNNFKKNAELGCSYAINMKIYSSIEANMREIINYYKNYEDKTSKSEMETCIKLYQEMVETYNNLYGSTEDKKI